MEDKTVKEIMQIVFMMSENQKTQFIQSVKKFLQVEEPSSSDQE